MVSWIVCARWSCLLLVLTGIEHVAEAPAQFEARSQERNTIQRYLFQQLPPAIAVEEAVESVVQTVRAARSAPSVARRAIAAAAVPARRPPAERGDRTRRRVYRITAYCDRGTTAAGIASGVGQCAAPADIPFGSTVYIPKLNRSFIVTDRTHARFRHNTVDIFIPSCSDARQFGRRYLECIVTLPEEPVRYASGELHRKIRRILD